MGQAIIKIKDRYFLYSTIVDAPITPGLTKEEMRRYMLGEAAAEAKLHFEASMRAVEEKGHSFRGCKNNASVADVVICNCAGPDDSTLTLEEIYEQYTHRP